MTMKETWRLAPGGTPYLTGFSDSVSFPISTGVVQPAFGGNMDGFVVKLNPNLPGPPAPPRCSLGAWDATRALHLAIQAARGPLRALRECKDSADGTEIGAAARTC